MVNVQCSGVTVKGLRCKLFVSQEVQYCHYHKNQQLRNVDHQHVKKFQRSRTTPASSNPQKRQERVEAQKGFIYVYTLQHLATPRPKKKDWLQVNKLEKSEAKERSWKVFNPKKHILIKIGLTTGTVDKRLKQWESKCNHSLTYLNPYTNYETTNSLKALFKNLRIKSTGSPLRFYKEEGHGFYTIKNLAKIEREIHNRLWKSFGRGDMVCHGCSQDKGYGIHIEWFMLERKNLKKCFELIDDVCSAYGQ
ncbi:hypothetical protein BN7_4260 [Wickerhamomyces ciferrii]|uniref:Bacteriophage T5 Orf172 DNA-binding domain-containing protein n=1 Tax=Wickerhamomyces ciferrii (strain ATCC 14091 / BCRC 22168 / CBS 111 / JCM 3599 / NBRC 0793 / NRRL Y-1031 F-60-10) TaxID=1206466 RepID=K0KRM8_WICCF|nr:uncharacterized protein BN7_4260 [Wickerhamomyces ciferrii]CCH44692.1 hypothetical protein BN7_4260 [Wickerhamomyces ciferrii]